MTPPAVAVAVAAAVDAAAAGECDGLAAEGDFTFDDGCEAAAPPPKRFFFAPVD